MTQQPFVFLTANQHRGKSVSTRHDLLAMLRHSTFQHSPSAKLIVLSGHASVYRLGLCAATDCAITGDMVLYVTGANIFDPFLVGRLACAIGAVPSRVLQHIHVSRAFTCHQMVRLVTDCLAPAIQQYAARQVILSGLLETLYDESVPDQEAARLFRTMLTAIQSLAHENVQTLCISPLPITTSSIRRGFLATLRTHANRVIDVRETDDAVWLHEQDTVQSIGWSIPRSVWDRL